MIFPKNENLSSKIKNISFVKNISLVLLTFSFIFLRLPEFNRFLWNDELISIQTTKENPLINPLYFGVSTNLPFYFYILKIFSMLGVSDENLRIASLFIATTTFIVVARFLLQNFKVFGVIFLSLFILSPLQIYYSIELRTYILTQLLLIIASWYFWKILNSNAINYFNFTLILFLGLISHYTAFLFISASFLTLLLFKKMERKTFYSFSISIFLSLVIYFLISQTAHFQSSLDESVFNRDFSRFSLFDLSENVLQIREVLTIYYNFGLHYYRIEADFLGAFKKFWYLNLLLFVFLIIKFKKYQEKKFWFFASLFFLSLIGAILADLLGVLDFGGRYIFPFHFLYLLGASYYFRLLFLFNKYFFGILFVLYISSYVFYNYCVSQNLAIFVGSGDPQGILFQKCYEKVMTR